MVKNLMNFVMLAKQGMKVNWSIVVFNNFYNTLWDLSAPTKPNTSKDIIEFKVAQVVDILLQYWFMSDSTLIPLKSNKEEEGAAKLQSEVQAVGTSRVSRMCFRCAPIDVNEEVDDVKEIVGMSPN